MKKIFILAVIAFSTIYNAAALDLNDYTVFSKLNNEKSTSEATKMDEKVKGGEKKADEIKKADKK